MQTIHRRIGGGGAEYVGVYRHWVLFKCSEVQRTKSLILLITKLDQSRIVMHFEFIVINKTCLGFQYKQLFHIDEKDISPKKSSRM